MTDIDENKIRRLDGSLLLVFRELLRLERTTLVADRLGLSQSAVSHGLRRLRSVFGDPLFVRRPHGLEPTRHAQELRPRIEALVAAMGEAIGLIDEFDAATTTRDFRIGAPDHVSTVIAPPLIRAFSDGAPQSKFALSQRLGADAIDALTRHEIDLALGRFGQRLGAELTVEPLFVDEYCVIARHDHPRLTHRLTARLYAELDHIQVSVAGDFNSLEIERVSTDARPRHTVAAVPRFLMAFPVVAASDAVALAPRRLAEAHAPAFGISLYQTPFQLEPISVVAVRRRDADPGVAWLVEQVRAVTTQPRSRRRSETPALHGLSARRKR